MNRQNRRVVYLDKRRDVEVMRRLQRMQRVRKGPVVIRHEVFADLLRCSTSSVRRSLAALINTGHITRAHVTRNRGGYLCAYHVDTSIIYRQASLVRRATRAIEQLQNTRKATPQAVSPAQKTAASKDIKSNKDIYNNNRHKDGHHLSDLLIVARAVGIDDKQRGYLRAAALRYGVLRTWEALQIAFERRRYATQDLVRVTWGILRRQTGH